MTNDCKTCPVSTGTHKPAEALHQIAEPDAQHQQELAAYRFTVENLRARVAELEERLEIDHRHPYDGIAARDATIKAQDERIAELEADLEAVGAGGVQSLRKQAAAQQAVQDAPLIARQLGEWHEDDGPVMWWAWNGMDWAGEPVWCGQPSDSDWPGYHTHWTPHPKQPEATAHPAEGVPAQRLSQATIDFLKETLKDCDDSARDAAIGHDIEKMLRTATHPTQQGLEQDAARWRMVALISKEVMIHPDKRTAADAVSAYMHAVHSGLDIQCAIDAALAAQAKQGGQA